MKIEYKREIYINGDYKGHNACMKILIVENKDVEDKIVSILSNMLDDGFIISRQDILY